MGGYTRIRRQRLLQEAEGYLDLILAASPPLPEDSPHRTRLARRAIAVLDQLDHREFTHGRAHYLRGQAFRLIAKYHQAIDAFQKAQAIEPENVHTMLSMAWCFKRIGHLDLAIETLEVALIVQPDLGIIHYNLSCYWSLANHLDPALSHLSRAIELQPEYGRSAQDEPDFDNIRRHPEFRALAQAVA